MTEREALVARIASLEETADTVRKMLERNQHNAFRMGAIGQSDIGAAIAMLRDATVEAS